MTTAVAGGTGFTGRRVAARLDARGGALRCLVRETSDTSVLPAGAGTVLGDLDDPAVLGRWLDGCEDLVYVASMGFGHVPAVVKAAEGAGVGRATFVSTTALFTRLAAPSKVVRQAAEAAVSASSLAWTIVRPTMIYGAPGDRNMERMLRSLVRWPLVVIPGNGRSLMQPVHVDDLADGIVAAHGCADAAGHAYDLSGKVPLSFDATIEAACRALGRSRPKLHLPLTPLVWKLRCLEAIGLRLRIRSEQLLRLAEDKAFSHEAAAAAFGFAPRGFPEGIAEEARLLGLAREGAA